MSLALFIAAAAAALTGTATATEETVGATFSALAAESRAPEDGYTLFSPTPDDKLRPMSTERPSKTDSALTLDAGRFQIETSLLSYTRNDNNGVKSTISAPLATTTLRLGLTEKIDAEVIFDAYRNLRVEDSGAGTDQHFDGYGDTVLRVKYNFFGNDGSKYALAILPYVKIPTNGGNLANDDVEGGIELPFNVNFDQGYSISGMTVVAVLKDSDDRDYSPSYINAIVLGKTFTDRIAAYGEFYTQRYTDENARWANSLDFGVIYSVNDRLHVDTGVNFGVSDASDDVNLFLGGAYRF